MQTTLREQTRAIWQAGVDAVLPSRLLPNAVRDDAALNADIETAQRILVVGAGKAGAAMSEALEVAFGPHLDKVEGIVNVPAGTEKPLRKIRLHPARPAGSNHPTKEGVDGANEMLHLLSGAGQGDVAICLLSGGGSALLPAPAAGITLEDKQAVTKLLHASGAAIDEMNTVRKHLSRIKGGRLARAFTGRALYSLIISDVIGDPLDVIASGPTVADTSTAADALRILRKFEMLDRVPKSVIEVLEGDAGERQAFPANVHNRVLGNNRVALDAARVRAEELGYRVLDLGAFIEGETSQAALVHAGIVRSIREDDRPYRAPVCILSGGETTVTLGSDSGKGGRNQEFVLALLAKLQPLAGVALLSGGTDGEDGPTDAAGAYVDDSNTITSAEVHDALRRHDAYPLLDRCGALLKSGLTQTNVMDLRVILVSGHSEAMPAARDGASLRDAR